jgi:UDP-N-acetylmuramoyl-L-alanyl-D-glutamate--2,6-diaminopimelate ligase
MRGRGLPRFRRMYALAGEVSAINLGFILALGTCIIPVLSLHTLFNFLRKAIPDQHPIRLFYHKLKAMAAAVIYRFPANEMTVIAVTGTNGKTTTANILHQVFSDAGHKVGMLSSLNWKIGDQEEANASGQSTMSPFLFQKKLRDMVKANCDVAVVEVTSHGLVQSRIWGVNVDTAVLTNFAQDHLDYHGTIEEYKKAKGLLFDSLNVSRRKPGVPKVSVINQDDAAAEYFGSFPVDHRFDYGIQRGAYAARNLVAKPDGTKFLLRIPNGEVEVDFKVPGRVNVYNALSAATVGVAHHINLQTIKAALEKMRPVPGRNEIIDEGQGFTVVVDYAFTENALEQLLGMYKELTQGKVITVFGATGDRDKNKRPKMGAVLHKLSDEIIVTNDDVYSEDPLEIARMLREGIPREEGDRLWQVLDRREAIRLALEMAEDGDTVLVAGRGADEFQPIGKVKLPFDDRQVVRELLAREVDVNIPH